MQSVKLCGYNNDYRINDKSNNKYQDGTKYISPSMGTSFNISTIISYSTYYHTVIVTSDGLIYGIGDNRKGQISKQLPSQIFNCFTEFFLTNEKGEKFHPISAFCGEEFTFYLISGNDRNQLVYNHYNLESKYPLILNINNFNPVSIFGGQGKCAAIGNNGSIICIESSICRMCEKAIDPSFLPDNEKAVQVACMQEFFIVLTSSGRVYEAKPKSKLEFIEIDELKGKEIISISGIYYHCFAVSKDGKVFVRGYSLFNHGQLGLGQKIKNVPAFTEISSLNKYKITNAYASRDHSLFQTDDGKILACGKNDYGQLFLKNGPSKNVKEPVETEITNASFCIVGVDTTIIFENYVPQMCPNKRILIDINKSNEIESSLLNERILDLEKRLQEQKEEYEMKLILKDQELIKQKEEYEMKLILKDQELIKQKEEYEKKLIVKDQELIKQKEEYEKKLILKDQELIKQKEEYENLKNHLISIQKAKSFELTFFDFNEYEEEAIIGTGATSIVKIVSKKQKYAMKELVLFDHKSMKRFLGECELLFRLRHPCIIRVYGFNNGDKTHKPSIILSFEPKSLETAIRNKELNEEEKNRIAVELVLGMRYIHNYKFMHRDLKPLNILLSKKNHVRITDFGLAKEEDLQASQSKGIGTLLFMAPELYEGNEEEEEEENVIKYTNKIDVYSFGIILIYMLNEKYPPKTVIRGIFPKLPSDISNWVRDLIARCLSFEPENRPSFAEIFEIMKANNFDMFSDSKDKKLTGKQREMKKDIKARIMKIESFEFINKL